MAVRFMDSFDHYDTGQIGTKWDGYSWQSISSGNGRWSTDAACVGINSGYWAKGLSSLQSYWVGIAINAGWNTGIFGFGDAGQPQIYLGVTADGKLQVRRGNESGTILWTSTDTLPTGYQYVEFYAKIDNAAGEFTVKVNEVEWIAATSQNTRGGSANLISAVTIFGTQPGGSGTWYGSRYADDFYVDDAQFNGDCRVQVLMPTGAGNSSQWSPSAGNNWECVNEKPAGTSDYVAEGTVGDVDTYVVEDLTPTSGTVYAVQGCFYCRKTDAGVRKIGIATRLGGADDAGAGIAVPSNWGWVLDIKSTKPGGGAWTVADVNNCEMGQKMVA